MPCTAHRFSALLAAALFASIPAAASERAVGETSRSQREAPQAFKHARYPEARVARVTYREMSLDRLLKLQRESTSSHGGPTRIGIARRASAESDAPAVAALHWVAAPGGTVARLELHSRDALALRVGLRPDVLDDRVELRFAGSDAPGRVVAAMSGREINALRGADGVFWTPSTDGETQLIEIFRPDAVPSGAVQVATPMLSHLVTNSRNDFKMIEKIGESGSCNVDTSCRIAELGPRFVDAKNAVAHMQYVRGGSTYICTGTLLADTDPATQVPYFYTANHCFATGTGAPVASQMQEVASTLNTFWNYEATSCSSGVATPRTQLSGGAAYLYSDSGTDAMLLRLNDAAPPGAFFAGWTAAPLQGGSAVLAIHHPRGDAKKVSSGEHVSSSGTLHRVGWRSGTTEGGSSGSALFTLGAAGYELRGGLYGGAASCANAASFSNPSNRDEYSRFDVVFPSIRHHLAAVPVPLNGSQPLVPPTAEAASVSSASAVETATPRSAVGTTRFPRPASRPRAGTPRESAPRF